MKKILESEEAGTGELNTNNHKSTGNIYSLLCQYTPETAYTVHVPDISHTWPSLQIIEVMNQQNT